MTVGKSAAGGAGFFKIGETTSATVNRSRIERAAVAESWPSSFVYFDVFA